MDRTRSWVHVRIASLKGEGIAGVGGTRQGDQLNRVERVEWWVPGWLPVPVWPELPDRPLHGGKVEVTKVVYTIQRAVYTGDLVAENVVVVCQDVVAVCQDVVFNNVLPESIKKVFPGV